MHQQRATDSQPRVAIVGGGLAGMAVAAGLAEAGFLGSGSAASVDIYEAKRQTGGRAGSFLDNDSGQEIDYCQHVAMGCCTNFLHLLKWAEINQHFHRYDTLHFLAPGIPPTNFAPHPLLPPPLHLAPAFSQLKTLTPSERRQVRNAMWRLMRLSPSRVKTAEAKSRRPMTMGMWLRRQGQEDGTILKFWNIVLASALGEHVDAVAILPARKVFVDGFLRARGASDILVPQKPLSDLFGKMLPARLSDTGIRLHASTRIRQATQLPNGTFELKIDNQPSIIADYLVLAIPWYALPKMLLRSNLQAAIPNLSEIGLFPSSPISGIHLWLNRQLTPLPHAVIVDAFSQWVFRNPRQTHSDFQHSDSQDEHYYQVVISAAHDVRGRPPEAVAEMVLKELRASFPSSGLESDAIEARRCKVVTDPTAVFSITPEVERQRPQTETDVPNFLLAGDWVQTGWPATMEGAIISGYAAAEKILQLEGRPTRLLQPPQKTSPLSRLLIKEPNVDRRR